MKKQVHLVFFMLCTSIFLFGQKKEIIPEYSKAGFFELPDNGRDIFNFNIGWRFFKGAIKNAEKKEFNDSKWDLINTPHGLELTSMQASGSNNYQGEAWYRKKFTIPESIKGKRLIIYFEAIMGKSKVWVNGELLVTNYGGTLPFSVDITNKIRSGDENVIAVWADNSDDPTFPPGKPQRELDYSYFGGIYRDVWLVATNKIFVTDAIQANKEAGGGVFVHYENLSDALVNVVVASDIANNEGSDQKIQVAYFIRDNDGNVVATQKKLLNLAANQSQKNDVSLQVKNPQLWSPKSPYLYDLDIIITGKNGEKIDGIREKIGIRKIEFRGKDGFYLNNKPYEGKLIGANRHQDFAYVGNALPNSGQWKDAVILKNGGCDIVRAAHYPADPAFMDACDRLGLFFIVATPGWQFWNGKDASFENGVYQNIRDMVRRDRNHAAVIMWEPILNETDYPDYFAQKVHNLVHQEYPFQGAYTVSDNGAKGQEFFDVIYSHPFKGAFWDNLIPNTEENRKKMAFDYSKESRSIFTREWGDCVDDWNSHNSPSRAARNWGETPQLVQAHHYANPDYIYTSLEALNNTPRQHVGGTLWHSFDHQRGYHPDPFYGGLTDVFRQPKYSYELFKSQRSVTENGPVIFIANEMTPFSPADVTVYSNCDEVRLIVYEKDTLLFKQDRSVGHMTGQEAVFKDVYHFSDIKNFIRQRKRQQANLVAEGLINGKVVVRTTRTPALRPVKIQLELYNQGIPLVANGSDLVTVIASIVDEKGNVKRLDNDAIKFEIHGEGKILGDAKTLANPFQVQWGTAPVLIQSTTTPGTITVIASILNEGVNAPSRGEITFTSIPSSTKLLFTENPDTYIQNTNKTSEEKIDTKQIQDLKRKVQELEKELNNIKLKEVEKQQQKFEGKAGDK